ncbi:MAG: hypothetical protein R3B82_01275 [Sandaracinaceae bacterium]
MRSLPAVLLLVLAACEGASTPGVRIELIDSNGENAAREIVEGVLAVRVRQGDQSLCDGGCSTPINGGTFELTLPIDSLVELTYLQAEITGNSMHTVGAVAPFAISGEFLETATVPVRIVMMDPGTCAPLDLRNVSTAGIPRLVEGRRDMAIAVRRNLVLLAGGRTLTAGSSRADFFDQVVVEMRPPLDDPAGALGPSRGLTISEDQSLVVGETAWIWDRQVQAPPAAVPLPTTLHAGAGFTSGLAIVNNSIAVIGGDGSDAVTWFTAQTALGPSTLAVPRTSPAVGVGREGILVVGGGPGAEWIMPPPVTGRAFMDDGIPTSEGGWIAVSPSRDTFLAIGGSGTQTTIFRGCPDCTVEDGPTWTRARVGASAVQTEAGVLWIVGGEGSALVDRVVWDDERPSIVEESFELSAPRAGAAVVEHASGVIMVVGGETVDAEGVSRMLDTVELCTPSEGLDALL